MSIEEVVGFVTGALCVGLAVRQNVWTFPIGIVNNVVYAVLFLGAGLYAGAGLQVVYLVLGALGWFWWVRGGTGAGRLRVQRTPGWGWVAAVTGAVAASGALVLVLDRWTDSELVVADAVTTGLSLTAQLMMGRKWLGSWAFWIVADVLFVALYASQGLWLTAVLYAGFIGLCVAGVREWRRDLAGGGDGDGPAGSAGQPAAVGAAAGADGSTVAALGRRPGADTDGASSGGSRP
jgi:nicotinamide mononucleotide transporter